VAHAAPSRGPRTLGVAVTAGITLASQRRYAAPLNWLRNRNLARQPRRGNHSDAEEDDEGRAVTASGDAAVAEG